MGERRVLLVAGAGNLAGGPSTAVRPPGYRYRWGSLPRRGHTARRGRYLSIESDPLDSQSLTCGMQELGLQGFLERGLPSY